MVTECVAAATPAVSVVTVEVMVRGLAVPTVASACTSLLSAGDTSPGQVHVMVVPAITHAARTVAGWMQKGNLLMVGCSSSQVVQTQCMASLADEP